MRKPIPIYKDHGETYQADTCVAVVEAAARGELHHQALARGHYPGRKLAPDALSGVKSFGFWDAGHDQAWGLPWHRNEGLELTFLESGSTGFAVDEQHYVLQPDDLTVTRPWQRHRVGDPLVGAGRLHFLIMDVGVRRPNQGWRWPPWVVLSKADLDELTTFLRHNEQPVWKAPADIRRCFQAIAPAVEGDHNISRLTVRVNDLFVLLLDMFRQQKVQLDESLSSSRRTVELFLADLRAHPEHLALQWTIHDMAGSCGLGVTQFVHHVKRLTNLTPLQYLQHSRLELASKMLRKRPEPSVTEVALACGFSSTQYFATVFHRRFGKSPREIRSREG